MSFSMEVSVLTGLAALATAGYLIRRNTRWDRASALFLLTVSSMQFADAALRWDGMAKRPDGSCSSVNWATSAILIPLILRAQLGLRQMEMRFRLFTTSVTVVVGAVFVGLLFFKGGDWDPALAWSYFTNRECSTPSEVAGGAPLWGGINMPILCFVMYLCMSMPPMVLSGRYLECAMFMAVLWASLSGDDARASRFCSVACATAGYYLLYAGPALPPHAHDHLKLKPGDNTFLKSAYAYERFCFGSAKP